MLNLQRFFHRLDYWVPKITGNAERDIRNYQQLQDLGWRVIIVWECKLKKAEFEETMDKLIVELKTGDCCIMDKKTK